MTKDEVQKMIDATIKAERERIGEILRAAELSTLGNYPRSPRRVLEDIAYQIANG